VNLAWFTQRSLEGTSPSRLTFYELRLGTNHGILTQSSAAEVPNRQDGSTAQRELLAQEND
jgi:hypothetical protein